MDFNWTLFTKELPPENTTVIVSNGPAIGNYHYSKESYAAECIVLLWDLEGRRYEVKPSELLQWSPIIKVPVKVIKLTRWQRFKNWLKGLL
jgi:hypothetical protein